MECASVFVSFQVRVALALADLRDGGQSTLLLCPVGRKCGVEEGFWVGDMVRRSVDLEIGALKRYM